MGAERLWQAAGERGGCGVNLKFGAYYIASVRRSSRDGKDTLVVQKLEGAVVGLKCSEHIGQ